MFGNMYLAYERLSESMKRLLDDLWCVHDMTIAKHNIGQYNEVRKRQPPVAQPIIRIHPETGKKGLNRDSCGKGSCLSGSMQPWMAG